MTRKPLRIVVVVIIVIIVQAAVAAVVCCVQLSLSLSVQKRFIQNENS